MLRLRVVKIQQSFLRKSLASRVLLWNATRRPESGAMLLNKPGLKESAPSAGSSSAIDTARPSNSASQVRILPKSLQEATDSTSWAACYLTNAK